MTTNIDALVSRYQTINTEAKKHSQQAWIGVIGGPILIVLAFVIGQWIVGALGAAALAWGLYDAVQAGHLCEELEALEAEIEDAEDDSDDMPAPPRFDAPTASSDTRSAQRGYSGEDGF